MFSFINFATVIVFLVTMFDDSTQLVTVPRSSPDPIAELCRALVVLKRERYHIREVFKLSSDGHTEKVYWYGRSQYIEALNAPHHINENVSCYTDYASGMRQRTPCKLDYDTHRVFDIVAPCNDEEDDVVVKRSILLPPENDGTVREVRIFDLDERDECGELPDPKTIEGLYRGYKDRDMYWTCADEKEINALLKHLNPKGAVAEHLNFAKKANEMGQDALWKLREEVKDTCKAINDLLHEPATRDAILKAQTEHQRDAMPMMDCGWLNWFPLEGTEFAEKFNTVRSTGSGPYFLDIDMPIIDQSVNVQSYGGDVVRDLVSKRLGIDIYYVRHLD